MSSYQGYNILIYGRSGDILLLSGKKKKAFGDDSKELSWKESISSRTGSDLSSEFLGVKAIISKKSLQAWKEKARF